MKQFLKNVLLTYFIMVVAAVGLLYAIHTIPFDYIKENLISSASILETEDSRYDFLSDKFGINIEANDMLCADSYTDAIMLIEACNIGKENTFDCVMRSEMYLGSDPRESLRYNVECYNKKIDRTSYSYYWHGYLVTLIPSLTMMDIGQIRVLNYVLFSLLIITISILMTRKIGTVSAMLFLLTLVVSFFPVIPYSLQLCSVFYVSFFAIIILLICQKFVTQRLGDRTFFFIIGGITSFVDFLTVPLVTCCLPLLFYLLLNGDGNRCKKIVSLMFFWGCGYVGVWAADWIIASIVLKENVIFMALHEVLYRLGVPISVTKILRLMWEAVSMPVPFTLCLLMVLYFSVAHKDWQSIKSYLWIVTIALIPMLWLCIVRNHSFHHFWFTWRNLVVTLFAMMLFVYKSTDVHNIKSNMRITKRNV